MEEEIVEAAAEDDKKIKYKLKQPTNLTKRSS